jgi:hypothetical protein
VSLQDLFHDFHCSRTGSSRLRLTSQSERNVFASLPKTTNNASHNPTRTNTGLFVKIQDFGEVGCSGIPACVFGCSKPSDLGSQVVWYQLEHRGHHVCSLSKTKKCATWTFPFWKNISLAKAGG